MPLAHLVKPDTRVTLKQIDPGDTGGISHAAAEERLAALNAELTALQETHAASGINGVLIILQGLDTAGKDGTIRHVMAQLNPAGCRVESFKVPTEVERAHDFLWRCHRVTPASGMMSIFNRSYYEDVLVVRVQKLAPHTDWQRRFEHINHFESLLSDSGTLILKFFLHISKKEQRDRLLAREQDEERAYKLSSTDWPTHALYDQYLEAYEDALSHCSTSYAPWYIVPADHKWFRNLAVAHTITEVLEPHRKQWKSMIEERGREALAARAAQRAAGIAPAEDA